MRCFFRCLRSGIIFGAGLYTGVYLAQNYQLDKVEDPKALFEKASCFIQEKINDLSKKDDKDDGKCK